MIFDLFSLQGQVAIVTGGASGLGRRMVQTLASAGASVVVADINESGARKVAEEQSGQGKHVTYVKMDVTQPESVEAAVEKTVFTHNKLDIGVNAAGVASGWSPHDTPYEIWQYMIEVNLSGVYLCCIEYAKIMKKQMFGKIINIASMSATIVNHFPQPPIDESHLQGVPAYCAAKAGVRQLTKVLAAEWARYGIRVNCISPGYMKTEMTNGLLSMSEVHERIIEDTPLGRIGNPGDLDGLILYLSSDASGFVTGSEMMVDGGYTIW